MQSRLNSGPGSCTHRRFRMELVRLAGLAFLVMVGVLVAGGLASNAQDAGGTSRTSPARLTQAANSRVTLVLPTSYQQATLYSGFEDERRGISFVIFEAPLAAYDEMKVAFTPETLATRGLTDGKAGQLTRDGDYVYMQAQQSSPAGEYAKFFVLFRTTDQTVLVSANVPVKELESGGATVAEIEQALSSARTVPVAQIKDLYKFSYLGPFKEAGRIAGTSKLFTLNGRLEPEQNGTARPALIVAPSIDKRAIVDINATAKALMQALPGYRDLEIGVPEPVTVSKLKGIALRGTAVDTQSETRFVIYQVLLVSGDGGYYRLVGLVPEAEAEKLLPEIVRITLSFEVMPS